MKIKDNMNTTIEKKSIYRLVKILEGLNKYSLEELQPLIEKIKTNLKEKTSSLGINRMVGKYYKFSRNGLTFVFQAVEIVESGMIRVNSHRVGGRNKTLQYWVGSYSRDSDEWQLVGDLGTFGIEEISKEDYHELQRI